MTEDADIGRPSRLETPSNIAVAIEGGGAAVLGFVFVAAGILAERYSLHDEAVILPAVGASAACSFALLAWLLAGRAQCAFNPAIALVLVLDRSIPLSAGLVFSAAHCLGAMAGIMTAHFVTGTGIVQTASLPQSGAAVWAGEAVATAAFITAACFWLKQSSWKRPIAGGAILFAAIIATPALSLTNPALTLTRSLTESYAAIALTDALIIALIQLVAAALAWTLLQQRPRRGK